MPAIGDTSTCEHCGESIAWMGSFWGHFGDTQPKHPATPIEVATVTTSDGYIVKTSDKRVIVCVNALAGYANPEALADVLAKVGVAIADAERFGNGPPSSFDANIVWADLMEVKEAIAKLKGGA